jgi:hypothetical protein
VLKRLYTPSKLCSTHFSLSIGVLHSNRKRVDLALEVTPGLLNGLALYARTIIVKSLGVSSGGT